MLEMFFVFIVRFDRYYDVAISLVARWPARYQKNSERARREKWRGSNRALGTIVIKQEPIKWSLHFPYKPLDSLRSRRFQSSYCAKAFFCSLPNFLDELARKRLLRRLALGVNPFPIKFMIRTFPRGDFARRQWEEPITTTKWQCYCTSSNSRKYGVRLHLTLFFHLTVLWHTRLTEMTLFAGNKP